MAHSLLCDYLLPPLADIIADYNLPEANTDRSDLFFMIRWSRDFESGVPIPQGRHHWFQWGESNWLEYLCIVHTETGISPPQPHSLIDICKIWMISTAASKAPSKRARRKMWISHWEWCLDCINACLERKYKDKGGTAMKDCFCVLQAWIRPHLRHCYGNIY